MADSEEKLLLSVDKSEFWQIFTDSIIRVTLFFQAYNLIIYK